MRTSLLVLALALSACEPMVGTDDGGATGGGAGGGSGGAGGGSQAGDGLPCDVATLVSEKCASCHGRPTTSSAPFALLARSDFTAASPTFGGTTIGERSLARMQMTAAPMPPAYAVQATPGEVSAFAAWVNGGMQAGTCVSMPPDAGPPMQTCTSGSHWTQGDRGSTVMNPGLACRACHVTQEPGRAYLFMGTVYPALHEEDLCNSRGLPSDTVVEIIDGNGDVRLTLTPNAAGNFYNTSRTVSWPLPYWARVRAGGKSNTMMTGQTDGDCNGCHTALGKNGAPGRIVAP
ncbi:MAG: hypothetical protein IPJ65_40010 [Archangiaceae bacterium]|nr:hypothetical protein [Archangiaceae bacterium]